MGYAVIPYGITAGTSALIRSVAANDTTLLVVVILSTTVLLVFVF